MVGGGLRLMREDVPRIWGNPTLGWQDLVWILREKYDAIMKPTATLGQDTVAGLGGRACLDRPGRPDRTAGRWASEAGF